VLELADSPVLVGVNGCRDTLGRSGLVDAAATGGQLVGDHQQHWAHEVHGLVRTPLEVGAPVHTVHAVLRSLAALLVRAEPPPVGLEDGARAVLIAEACRHAARSGGSADVAGLDP
jgi:hypothetical protein